MSPIWLSRVFVLGYLVIHRWMLKKLYANTIWRKEKVSMEQTKIAVDYNTIFGIKTIVENQFAKVKIKVY